MEKTNLVYAEVIGEPYLSRCVAYREQSIAAIEAQRLYSVKMGAEGFHSKYAPGAVLMLTFGNKKPPEGWTVPKGRNGASTPKKRSKDYAENCAVPHSIRSISVYDGIPQDIHYKHEDLSIHYSLYPWMFSIPVGYFELEGRIRYIMVLPDVEANLEEFYQYDYGYEIVKDRSFFNEELVNFKIDPTVFRVMTDAEKDLMYAMSKVEQERLKREAEWEADV